MKSSVQRKTAIPLILITLILACDGLLPPNAFGVVPPPDGGYPGANTAEGQNALLSRTTGGFNTAVGWFSLKSLTTGSFNTGVGAGTLVLNSGDENTATGVGALTLNTTGGQNTATGVFALFSNTNGDANTANGVFALFSNTEGRDNTAIGDQALFSNTNGDANTANGFFALVNNTEGSNNIALGVLAGDQVTTASNVICIGASGANVDNSCYIGQIFGGTVPGGATVVIDSNGHIGTIVSSQRFKDQIKPMDQASEAIFALKPVTFRYKKELDPEGIPQFGLVAEEVENVNPDLVSRDGQGKVYTVRYDAVNAMLLNEFLKEHRAFLKEQRKVEAQEATITELKSTVAQQQKGMEVFTAQLKEQGAQIQKVSAQIEMNRSAPEQVVLKTP